MADADAALARLERAVDHGERIAIWGDYDADGMTAVVVWSLALRAWAWRRSATFRRGLAEGYGLSSGRPPRLAAAGVTPCRHLRLRVGNVAEVASRAAWAWTSS